MGVGYRLLLESILRQRRATRPAFPAPPDLDLDRWRPNGCTSSPDRVGGVFIGECCARHDAEYAIGGTKADRQRADRLLRACIERRLRRRLSDWQAALVAQTYRHAVAQLGGSHWRWVPPQPRRLALMRRLRHSRSARGRPERSA